MKLQFTTLRQQTQDFFLRLFVESSGSMSSGSECYTCSRCGTFTRLRQ